CRTPEAPGALTGDDYFQPVPPSYRRACITIRSRAQDVIAGHCPEGTVYPKNSRVDIEISYLRRLVAAREVEKRASCGGVLKISRSSVGVWCVYQRCAA